MAESPKLAYLLSAYFHQDWRDEHDSVAAVADGFRASEDPDQVSGVQAELTALLAQGLDDDALGARLQALGCEYQPDEGGWRPFAETLLAQLGA